MNEIVMRPAQQNEILYGVRPTLRFAENVMRVESPPTRHLRRISLALTEPVASDDERVDILRHSHPFLVLPDTPQRCTTAQRRTLHG
jgi:hypothetical protein